MKALLLPILALATVHLHAQVTVDVPLRLTGVESERRVEGMGSPISGDAGLTVEGSVRSEWTWADASVSGSTINLITSPPISSYRAGLLVRFLAPTSAAGTLSIAIDGLGSVPLLRPDGEPIFVGHLDQGSVAEVMYAEGSFYLLNAPNKSCPPGSLAINSTYCIEAQGSTSTMGFMAAVDHCANKGGKMCTWGEFYTACADFGSQMPDLFMDWEWMDDTSNHTHGGNQVGRTTCQSQRTIIITSPAKVRCCYHPR